MLRALAGTQEACYQEPTIDLETRMSDECIFCEIGRDPSNAAVVYRDNVVFAINDINPKAPIHMLIIPIKHITGLSEMAGNDELIMMYVALAAEEMAKRQGISKQGFRLIINQGQDAGQTINHLHAHMMGGKSLGDMG